MNLMNGQPVDEIGHHATPKLAKSLIRGKKVTCNMRDHLALPSWTNPMDFDEAGKNASRWARNTGRKGGGVALFHQPEPQPQRQVDLHAIAHGAEACIFPIEAEVFGDFSFRAAVEDSTHSIRD